MKTSIVIPAYNEEILLPQTLKSLLSMNRKPDEILIVDAQSTDKTREVAEQLGARVLTVEHRGIGYARQKGLEAATGDIVACTDADTLVPPQWLDKIVQTLEKPGVSGVYSAYSVDKGWWVYLFFVNYVNPVLFYLFYLLGIPLAGGQNIAFWKQKALESGGFPIEFKSVEDFEMIRRLKTVGRVIYRSDNFVLSSGRRGKEGFGMVIRVFKGMMVYYLTGKAHKFEFPDIR